uniref:Uncharacterized protein n=1 Tax=Spongospora subterranea TaxID=70186 RepID=A0A0H5QRK4_9EUKA|eukprot:CRZ04670.1 hypothetical protein [Spongospora subterranea]
MMVESANQRLTPMNVSRNGSLPSKSSHPSDILRREMLEMENRLAKIKQTQQEARLKYESILSKNKGCLWENSRPQSIRKFAAAILAKSEQTKPVGIRQMKPGSRRIPGRPNNVVGNDRRKGKPDPSVRFGGLTIHENGTTNKSSKAGNASSLEDIHDGIAAQPSERSYGSDMIEDPRPFQEARNAWLESRRNGIAGTMQLLSLLCDHICRSIIP